MMRIIVARSPCWLGNWGMRCLKKPYSACGTGALGNHSFDLLPQLQSNFDSRMRKAALLYNPDSGGSKQRRRELQSALSILRDGGVEAELLPTQSPRHSGEATPPRPAS